ncbi:DUF6530 family protein [Clostridioides sp. ES-S-0123-01]|uniref:DUF6530 family protein n=1 Tax=Clostridioides sp. ES-S-0123-01 TaxID=2770783 RepID=UPI001D1181B8
MRVAEYLSHKPIVAVDNYDRIDGKYANNSDAKALSLEKTQNKLIISNTYTYTTLLNLQ